MRESLKAAVLPTIGTGVALYAEQLFADEIASDQPWATVASVAVIFAAWVLQGLVYEFVLKRPSLALTWHDLRASAHVKMNDRHEIALADGDECQLQIGATYDASGLQRRLIQKWELAIGFLPTTACVVAPGATQALSYRRTGQGKRTTVIRQLDADSEWSEGRIRLGLQPRYGEFDEVTVDVRLAPTATAFGIPVSKWVATSSETTTIMFRKV